MEPPRGFLASCWSFIHFLPYFLGLLLLGTIKGIVLCPLICVIMTFGNTATTLLLWPVHVLWTFYSILRSRRLGPVLKVLLFICLPIPLLLWPVFAIIGSLLCGCLYGLFSPIFATFKAVGEGKADKLFHCFYDGTWDTVMGACTVVHDFKDILCHTYLSCMNDLQRNSPDGKYFEIRILRLPGAAIASTLGIMVDFPMISLIALFKSPYMLFKGWNRLFHDLIGREGPFLDTICVPFAGLAILLWPLAVSGAVVASVLSSILLGAYAGIVVYQENSFWYGLCYILSSLSIFDEYSNDVLDMPYEGSCFPRPKYRDNGGISRTTSLASTVSRFNSFKNQSLSSASFSHQILDIKPLELLDLLFKECHKVGEVFITEGLITWQDIEDAKSQKENTVIGVGLPAYCLLQCILRSAKSNSSGLLLRVGDDFTEISSSNRPKDAFFDWFFNPFLVMKEQIKASNLSEDEEEYLSKLVLLNGDPLRFKNSGVGKPPVNERRQAEFDGVARRLHGLTKSVSRYPTSRRQFGNLVRTLSEDLAKTDSESGSYRPPRPVPKAKSSLARMFSQKSFKRRLSSNSSDPDGELGNGTVVAVV